MATYKISTPDGSTYNVTAPDDASQADVMAYAQQQHAAPTPAAPSPQQPSDASPHFGTSAPGRLLQGLIVDPVIGGAQAIVNAVPKVADFVGAHDYANDVRAKAAQMNTGIQQYYGEYQNDRSQAAAPSATLSSLVANQPPADPGIDWLRGAGSVLSPINRLVPMGGAMTLPVLAARGAMQGGLSGSLAPVTDGGNNYWASKGLDIAGGAALGGALAPVADKALQIGNSAVQAVRSRLGQGVDPQAVEKALQASDIDLAQVPQSMLAQVKQQVGASLAKGQGLDPVAALRKAEGDLVLGPDNGLTLGQSTRDPQQFANEQNLRGVNDAGKPLADRFNRQSNALLQALNAKGAADTPSPIDTGNALLDALHGADASSSAKVNALYQTFRTSGGINDELPGTVMAQKLGDVIDTYGQENIPGAVARKMNDYGFLGGTKTKTFTLDEADKLNKIINANYDPANRPQAAALDALRSGIRETFNTAAGDATNAASSAYAPAVKAASDRFSAIDNTPALKAALSGAAPDNFLSKYLLGADQRDVASLRSLTEQAGPTAPFGNAPSAADTLVRKSIVGQLKEAATGGAADELGKFSQSGFNKALAKIGDQRLSQYFSSDEIAQLKQLGRVASYTQVPPPGAAVNGSNTAAAVMNLLSGMAGKVPGHAIIGLPVNMLANGIKRYGQDTDVRNALSGQVPTSDTNEIRRWLTGF